jgi:hypothetical protein
MRGEGRSRTVGAKDDPIQVSCQAAGLAVGKRKVYEGPAPVGKGPAAARSGRRPGLGSSCAWTQAGVRSAMRPRSNAVVAFAMLCLGGAERRNYRAHEVRVCS